jgi:hypothetical protein
MTRFLPTMRWGVAFMCVFSGMHDGIAAGDAKENDSVVQTIIRKWRERTNSVRSFDIHWEGTQFKSGALLVIPFSRPSPEEMPPKEVEYPTTHRYAIDEQDRLRFEERRMAWFPEKRALGAEKLIKLSNDSGQYIFFPFGHIPYPVAHVVGGGIKKVGRDVCVRPIRLAYRALDPDIGLCDARDLKLADGLPIAGSVVLDHGNGLVWVNSAQDFLPVRCTWTTHGVTTNVIEITNEYDKEYGWRPASWTNTILNEKAQIVIADIDRITQFALNCKISASDFQLSFPTGTWVSDNVRDERYIVLGEGQRRDVLKGEFNGQNYDALLNSKAGALVRKKTARTSSWPIEMLFVCAIFAAALFVGIRHYKFRRQVWSRVNCRLGA